jgi:hypothetical protein
MLRLQPVDDDDYYSLTLKIIASEVLIHSIQQRMRTASSITTSGRKERKKGMNKLMVS